MIDNVRNNQIAQGMGMSALPYAEATSRPAADGSGGSSTDDVLPVGTSATLQVSFADLVREAIQESQTQTDAVQKAKELLQAGQLTTPQNIRSAAANIVEFGI
jgi:hypothetical protein